MSVKSGRLGLSQTDWNWLFGGIAGPLLPPAVAGLAILTRWAVPLYGLLVLLAAVVVMSAALLTRQRSISEDQRKALKALLDASWNFWALLGVGTLAVSFQGGQKLEDMLKPLSPGWLSFVIVTACNVAALRLALSLAEGWLLARSLYARWHSGRPGNSATKGGPHGT